MSPEFVLSFLFRASPVRKGWTNHDLFKKKGLTCKNVHVI